MRNNAFDQRRTLNVYRCEVDAVYLHLNNWAYVSRPMSLCMHAVCRCSNISRRGDCAQVRKVDTLDTAKQYCTQYSTYFSWNVILDWIIINVFKQNNIHARLWHCQHVWQPFEWHCTLHFAHVAVYVLYDCTYWVELGWFRYENWHEMNFIVLDMPLYFYI